MWPRSGDRWPADPARNVGPPDKPGLSIKLNEEAFKHYRPVSRDRQPVVGADGALRNY